MAHCHTLEEIAVIKENRVRLKVVIDSRDCTWIPIFFLDDINVHATSFREILLDDTAQRSGANALVQRGPYRNCVHLRLHINSIDACILVRPLFVSPANCFAYFVSTEGTDAVLAKPKLGFTIFVNDTPGHVIGIDGDDSSSVPF
jgi:hypothetical protein